MSLRNCRPRRCRRERAVSLEDVNASISASGGVTANVSTSAERAFDMFVPALAMIDQDGGRFRREKSKNINLV
jgi:hypothetical protein